MELGEDYEINKSNLDDSRRILKLCGGAANLSLI